MHFLALTSDSISCFRPLRRDKRNGTPANGRSIAAGLLNLPTRRSR
jgi:hypothetical protein